MRIQTLVLFVVPILGLASGCAAAPLYSAVTENPQVQVDYLFEHDGCRVYRFRDGGQRIYYTDCRGSTAWSQACGRNCTRPMAVSTLR